MTTERQEDNPPSLRCLIFNARYTKYNIQILFHLCSRKKHPCWIKEALYYLQSSIGSFILLEILYLSFITNWKKNLKKQQTFPLVIFKCKQEVWLNSDVEHSKVSEY